MPEVFRELGYRFYFYSDDHLPIHIHVSYGDGEAKFNVSGDGATLVVSNGMKANELKTAKRLIEANIDEIIICWIQYFS
ncbi:MAG: DUF4160 domain-containing protein [Paludibacter sp.]|nr:DUF4160 domain-containing protein [Paludibacter sp.]